MSGGMEPVYIRLTSVLHDQHPSCTMAKVLRALPDHLLHASPGCCCLCHGCSRRVQVYLLDFRMTACDENIVP